jgi:hypothetical protein
MILLTFPTVEFIRPAAENRLRGVQVLTDFSTFYKSPAQFHCRAETPAGTIRKVQDRHRLWEKTKKAGSEKRGKIRERRLRQ